MTSPHNLLYSAAQTRELDAHAASKFGLSIETLMFRAGQAAFRQLKKHWPTAKNITVLCGNGHNGGDGLVLAKLLNDAGDAVQVYQADQQPFAPATQSIRQILLVYGVSISALPKQLSETDLIVDALLGTGLNRNVSGHYEESITLVNAASAPVFSLDIPSGLDADNGFIRGNAIKADVTLSFLGLNTGLFTAEAADHVGTLLFDDLDIPTELYESVLPQASLIQYETYQSFLSPRKRNAHKGLYGHTWIIGGDQSMSGAVRMSAEASLRVGSGLCSVITHPKHANQLNIGRPELMCYGIAPSDNPPSRLAQASVIALGPGLGQSGWSHSLYQLALEQTCPLVMDADALNLLAKMPEKRQRWVLTPHPGEAATLLGWSTLKVQQNRFDAVQAIQAQYGGVVVLKGMGTLIYDGDTTIKLSRYGNPGMSSGGMGDVLTGIIAGLIAQGISRYDAACLGVILHGLAGDQAAESLGERGLLATDLLPYLHTLVNPS